MIIAYLFLQAENSDFGHEIVRKNRHTSIIIDYYKYRELSSDDVPWRVYLAENWTKRMHHCKSNLSINASLVMETLQYNRYVYLGHAL